MEIDYQQLLVDIADAEHDTNSLQHEIDTLQRELLAVNGTISSVEKDIKAEEVAIKHIKDKESSKKPRQYDELDPPIVRHSYFDQSIGQYFDTGDDFGPRTKKIDINDLAIGISQSSKTLIGLRENILYENMYRLGGLTAFPLQAKDYLGLRFDSIPSGRTKFYKPHYVILRRRVIGTKTSEEKSVWETFKYTIPSQVVDKFAVEGGFETDEQVDDFAHGIFNGLRDMIVVEAFVHELKEYEIRDSTVSDEVGQYPISNIETDNLTYIRFSVSTYFSVLNVTFTIESKHSQYHKNLIAFVISEIKIERPGRQLTSSQTEKLYPINAALIGAEIERLPWTSWVTNLVEETRTFRE